MINKVLGPGGDYNTLPQVVSYLHGEVTVPGLTDDITIKVRSGSYGSDTVLNLIGGIGDYRFNGYTIRFTGFEADADDPPLVKGPWAFRVDAGGNPGYVKFDHIKISGENGLPWLIDQWDQNIITIEDSLIYYKQTSGPGGPKIIENGGDPQYPTIRGCQIFITAPNWSSGSMSIVSLEYSYAHNNLLCFFRAVDGDVSFTRATSYNNTIYNYGAGNVTTSGGFDSGTTKDQDPKLVDQIIQAADDSPATMAARNAKQTAQSYPLRNNAYVPEITATDINRKVRT